MIYINYDGPASPMLHTKFRGDRPTGSGEEDLGHVTWTIYINFRSPFLRMLHMKFGFDWPSGSLKLWTTDDGRTPKHGYTISSPVSLRLR